MKIAVIGSGIFGCTAAIFAAMKGHEVHVYDKAPTMLAGATSHNQFRLHAGYHYPRSPETVRECQRGLQSFCKFYASAISGDAEHYYAIAAKDSKINAGEYLEFLNKLRLPYTINTKVVDNTQITIRVSETSLDVKRLHQEIIFRFNVHKIQFHGEVSAHASMLDTHDRVIVATYANTNEVLVEFGVEPEIYQFEVVEKPVLDIPNTKTKRSVVVMDGPFCSVDPYPSMPGLYLMGHVEQAIWHRNIGTHAEIPKTMIGYINRGIISDLYSYQTQWPQMQEVGSKYLPSLMTAKHVGSLFTVRTVLADMDDTDARPTLVRRMSEKVIRIYSGKIPTAVDAAQAAVMGL